VTSSLTPLVRLNLESRILFLMVLCEPTERYFVELWHNTYLTYEMLMHQIQSDSKLWHARKHSAILPIFLLIFGSFACHFFVILFFSASICSYFFCLSSCLHPVYMHAFPCFCVGFVVLFTYFVWRWFDAFCYSFITVHVKCLQLKIDLCY